MYEHSGRVLNDIIKRLVYKPGWTLTIVKVDDYRIGVKISVTRPDCRNPMTLIDIHRTEVFDKHDLEFRPRPDIVLHHLAHAILDMEKHESYQWLKIDGKYLYKK